MGVQISNQVEERLLFEVNASCALCGFRDERMLTFHHIEPDKNNSYDNLIVLCHNCHNCHHQGKGISQEDIQKKKKHLIRNTLTQFGLNALKEAYRKDRVYGLPFLLTHLLEMGYLSFAHATNSRGGTGKKKIVVEAEYLITDKGKALLEKWSLK